MEYNLMIENSYKIENEDFSIYASPSLREFADVSFNELNSNKKRILDFFQISDFRKVTVIQFDDKDAFRKFVLSLREPGAHLPEYASGVFDKGMIISFIALEVIKNKNEFTDRAKTNVHEFIHIVNREKIYKQRVTWLDEGLATNLDEKRYYLKDDEKFIQFLKEKILNNKDLPIVNDLSHQGSGFKQEFYDGYDLVYFSVRFLLEKNNKDKVLEILKNYDLSIEIGKTILKDAIDYYKNKFNL